MPARKQTWLRSQITVGNMMNFGAILVALAGFYFTTNATLENHAKAIIKLEKELQEDFRKTEKRDAALLQDRDKLRAEMIERSERTATGISELNKQTAVLSTQLTGIKDELIKLSTQFSNQNRR